MDEKIERQQQKMIGIRFVCTLGGEPQNGGSELDGGVVRVPPPSPARRASCGGGGAVGQEGGDGGDGAGQRGPGGPVPAQREVPQRPWQRPLG